VTSCVLWHVMRSPDLAGVHSAHQVEVAQGDYLKQKLKEKLKLKAKFESKFELESKIIKQLIRFQLQARESQTETAHESKRSAN